MAIETDAEQRKALRSRTEDRCGYAVRRRDHFESLGKWWHWGHLFLGVLAPLLAAVAGLSLVKDLPWFTGSLAVASAIVGTLTVALNAGRKSHRSYDVGTRYRHVAGRAEDFLATRLDYASLAEAKQEFADLTVAIDTVDNFAVETHDAG